MQFTCAICYDSLSAKKIGETNIASTVCGHVFHSACIHKWLQKNRSCPECRGCVTIKRLTKLYIHFSNDDDKAWKALNKQLSEKKLECMKQEQEIMLLRTHRYLSERKIYSQEEEIVELETRFANSELQILEKNLEIEELQTQIFLSKQENSNKEKKIKELQTYFVNSELQILEKDAKIDELQTWFAHSEIENLLKDDTIKELQTCCARLELEVSEKYGKIEKLQTRISQTELENSKKDEKIEQLQTCCANFEIGAKKMLQQQMKLNDEISAMKREAIKLSCVEDENQKLVEEKKTLQNEKNILMSELEHLQTVKTIIEECSIDARKKILVDVIGQVSNDDDNKMAIKRIATYCSLLEQKLNHSKEENADLQNKLIKLKQELIHSKEKSTWVPNKFKLVKHELRKSHLKSAKGARQLRDALRQLREQVREFKDLNSSSFSSSFGPNSVMPCITNNIPTQCKNLDQCSLVCSLNLEGSSGCKNQIIPITEDFLDNKRQKVSLDCIKKYSEDSPEQ